MRPLPEYFDGIRLPRYVFYLTLGMLMLVSGLHVGLITLLHEVGGNDIILCTWCCSIGWPYRSP